MRRAWTSHEPFDYDGKYYQLKNVYTPVKPLQQPHVPLSFGGSSDAAYHVAAKHCDLYALWAEPLADVAEQIGKLKAAAAINVTPPRVSVSARLIIWPTKEVAWERAHGIAETLASNRRGAAANPCSTGYRAERVGKL